MQMQLHWRLIEILWAVSVAGKNTCRSFTRIFACLLGFVTFWVVPRCREDCDVVPHSRSQTFLSNICIRSARKGMICIAFKGCVGFRDAALWFLEAKTWLFSVLVASPSICVELVDRLRQIQQNIVGSIPLSTAEYCAINTLLRLASLGEDAIGRIRESWSTILLGSLRNTLWRFKLGLSNVLAFGRVSQ